MRAIALLLLLAAPALAQPGETYKRVARLLRVVSDVEMASQAWRKTGVPVEEAAPAEFRAGRAARPALAATGLFGNLRVDWLQPANSAGPPGAFPRKRGQGACALAYEMPDAAAVWREVEHFEGLGVRLVGRGAFVPGQETTEHALPHTAALGKIVPALVAANTRTPAAGGAMRVSQLAFAVRDPEPVSAFWRSPDSPRSRLRGPR